MYFDNEELLVLIDASNRKSLQIHEENAQTEMLGDNEIENEMRHEKEMRLEMS